MPTLNSQTVLLFSLANNSMQESSVNFRTPCIYNRNSSMKECFHYLSPCNTRARSISSRCRSWSSWRTCRCRRTSSPPRAVASLCHRPRRYPRGTTTSSAAGATTRAPRRWCAWSSPISARCRGKGRWTGTRPSRSRSSCCPPESDSSRPSDPGWIHDPRCLGKKRNEIFRTFSRNILFSFSFHNYPCNVWSRWIPTFSTPRPGLSNPSQWTTLSRRSSRSPWLCLGTSPTPWRTCSEGWTYRSKRLSVFKRKKKEREGKKNAGSLEFESARPRTHPFNVSISFSAILYFTKSFSLSTYIYTYNIILLFHILAG